MASKINWHIIEPRRIRGYDQSVITSRAGVKVVGGPSELGILSYYHEKNPSALYVARVFDWCKAIGDMYATKATPIAAANVMYNALHGFVRGAGMEWAWWECGPNEPGDDAIDWLDAYYINLIPRLAADGIKSVAYNFSVCHPPLAAWARLSKSLKAIRAAGPKLSAVGLHQYGLHGNMWEHAQDGNDARVLRHRCIPEIAELPVVLTETGLDEPGWQRTTRGTDGYLDDLIWLDNELQKDTNVLGAFIFTCDMEPGWQDYRIEGDLAIRLFQYVTTENASIVEIPGDSLPPTKHFVVDTVGGLNLRRSDGSLIALLPRGTVVEPGGVIKDRTNVRVILEGSILTAGIKKSLE